MSAIVYTETTVHAPPESLAAEAPYQLAIVEFPDGSRRTVRIRGPHVSIGDPVSLVEELDGVAFFQRT
ncbi:MAG TPA: OB-fold domain-containing protein [Bryobacteraceae bacterium]|nr:OB-fold domain-containing protein [Bryobacteraceae bacterium]